MPNAENAIEVGFQMISWEELVEHVQEVDEAGDTDDHFYGNLQDISWY